MRGDESWPSCQYTHGCGLSHPQFDLVRDDSAELRFQRKKMKMDQRELKLAIPVMEQDYNGCH